ncbi:hypothetical protein Tco_0608814 [Tanacetum coccineum]
MESVSAQVVAAAKLPEDESRHEGILLMALPNEHQLKFNTYKSAKTLMEAIEKSTNEAVKTAHGVSAANSKNNASTLPNVDSLRDGLEVANGNADNESKDISQEDRKESRWAPKNQDSRNREITRRTMPNGNKVLKRTVGETEQEYEPTTAEEKQDKRNEMKVRETLLMALPNKDQLKFL